MRAYHEGNRSLCAGRLCVLLFVLCLLPQASTGSPDDAFDVLDISGKIEHSYEQVRDSKCQANFLCILDSVQACLD